MYQAELFEIITEELPELPEPNARALAKRLAVHSVITNPYSVLGSPYSPSSATNPYALSPLKPLAPLAPLKPLAPLTLAPC